MTENAAERLIASIRAVAEEVVRAEIRDFRDRLGDACGEAVQAAFQRFVSSPKLRAIVREELGSSASASAAIDPRPAVEECLRENEEIRKAIARMVEDVLASGPGPEGAGPYLKEAVSKCVQESLRGRLGDTIGAEIRGFFSSEEMKELLDSKFRAIDLYLKTDLIPKVVKRELSKALESG